MANAVSTNGHEDAGGGGGVRPPRLPRWTRQEILVLIQGKKMAESRGRGRSRLHQMGSDMAPAPLVGVGAPIEPKWASVSSYCKRHGVNRGPVQCRKRWSNLAGDFKKIKEWELRREATGGTQPESFWSMRNDVRRERRLPGFFDREVYDILDGTVEVGGDDPEPSGATAGKEAPPVQQPSPATATREDEDDDEPAFDSGRAAADDGLFSDFDPEEDAEDEDKPPPPIVAATPISERKSDSIDPSTSDQAPGKQPVDDPGKAATPPPEARKRKRSEDDDGEGTPEPTLESRLIAILEQNSRMLNAQLQAHNINSQQDREQRRELTDSVVQVLSKLADAIGRIAEKL